MAKITFEERRLLRELRQRLADVDKHEEVSEDYELVRWLRARDHDPEAAEKMLRKSLKWRDDIKLNAILSWTPPTDFVSRNPVHVGKTKDNRTFMLMPYGKWNLKEDMETEERREISARYLFHFFEKMTKPLKGQTDKDGIPITQFVLIADFTGYSMMTQLSLNYLKFLKNSLGLFDANWPERLGNCWLLNPSASVSAFLAVARTVLAANTMGKFQSLKSDPHYWKQYLLEHIDANQLPVRYGGTLTNSVIDSLNLNE